MSMHSVESMVTSFFLVHEFLLGTAKTQEVTAVEAQESRNSPMMNGNRWDEICWGEPYEKSPTMTRVTIDPEHQAFCPASLSCRNGDNLYHEATTQFFGGSWRISSSRAPPRVASPEI